ncbi:putative mitochondrial protein AtMg00240 [Apium graveolens]|uniref:putative mitochondrial protein AtMg00240 n=1 Tax=Apium graveolens TaxID=4045 RepID=UPI003D79F4CB
MDSHMTIIADKGELLSNPQGYQKLLGKSIDLTLTRPDLSFPVHNLAQYMQKPTTVHMQAAKQILRYMLNNPAQGNLLASSLTAQLTVYCDSDWASCPNTRKLTFGYCVLVGTSPISWKSKK